MGSRGDPFSSDPTRGERSDESGEEGLVAPETTRSRVSEVSVSGPREENRRHG